MKQEITLDGITYRVGDYVIIEEMKGEPYYKNKCGKITIIDDKEQLHGTWGGLALITYLDKFRKIENPAG